MDDSELDLPTWAQQRAAWLKTAGTIPLSECRYLPRFTPFSPVLRSETPSVIGIGSTLLGLPLVLVAVLALRWDHNLWFLGALGGLLLVIGALSRRVAVRIHRIGLFVFPEGLLLVRNNAYQAVAREEVRSIHEQDGIVVVERIQGPPFTTRALGGVNQNPPTAEAVARARETVEALARWHASGQLPEPPGETVPSVPRRGVGGALLGTLLPSAALAIFLFLTLVMPALADTDKVCRRFVMAASTGKHAEATALLAAPLRTRIAQEGFDAVVPQDLRRATDITYNGVSGGSGTKNLEVWVSIPGGSPTWCFRMTEENNTPRVAGWRASSCKRARW